MHAAAATRRGALLPACSSSPGSASSVVSRMACSTARFVVSPAAPWVRVGHGGSTAGPSRARTGLGRAVVAASMDGDGDGDGEASEFRVGRRVLFGAVVSGVALSTVVSSGLAIGDAGLPPVPGPLKNLLPSLQELGNAGPAGDRQSRVYDATVLGEPATVGGDKSRVWDKLLGARIIYLGEAELVPDPEDKLLEVEIVRTLREKCGDQQRAVSVALEVFPRPFQPQLNQFVNKELSSEELRSSLSQLPDEQWQQILPLLGYCRDNGVRILACGTPAEVLRKIQANGVQALTGADQKLYVPVGGTRHGALSLPFPVVNELFQRGPYQFAQARIVSENTMAQVVSEYLAEGDATGLLVLITGASHVEYGVKGSGVPARVPKRLQRKNQVVVLLNPERQRIRQEGDVPEADFLWYSSAKGCTRNCFNRAEIARVMDAAGRRRDALPKDLQAGIDQGLVSPELLKVFFDLDKQPMIADLTQRFQGLRERWLADPRFLQRLALEESISITTTLIAQYERRGPRFWQELEYVITDTVRGAVVDFFTVWLPAPTLSFRSLEPEAKEGGFVALEGLKGLLGSVPDNAFQRARPGEFWDLKARALAVVVGGVKLFGVGFISSLGTVSITNMILAVRQQFNPELAKKRSNKRSPIFKTALLYASFLGTSANLRYQAIAGLVEHWVADYLLASEPLAGNVLSFVARTANSYWGSQQWVDLARFTGLQAHNDEAPPQSENSGQRSLEQPRPDVVLGRPDVVDTTPPLQTLISISPDVSDTTAPLQSLLSIPKETSQEESHGVTSK